MNRIIIIGNGFDLAHGMKTSYKDFLNWYFYKAYTDAESTGLYEDDLMYFKIDILESRTIFNQIDELKKYKNYIFEIPNVEYQGLTSGILPNTLIANFISKKNPYCPLAIVIKNPFISLLINNCLNYNWVDIENEYYNYLKKCLFEDKKDIWSISVSELNIGFKKLKILLEEYLSTIVTPRPSSSIDNIFREPLNYAKASVRKNPQLNIANSHPVHYVFLNFNYTNTIENYFKNFTWDGISTHIQIHGNILNKENPIIFGYGDEMDKAFERIEELGVKENMECFKTYWYSFTSNYRKLNKMIEMDEYEVQILGHSCGLSDRVMLNAIFEHKNCKEIFIYYYQKDKGVSDYLDIYQNISRNFSLKNRNTFRNIVASLEESEPFPQLKDL